MSGEPLGRWQRELAAGIRHMQGVGEIGPGPGADREAAVLPAGIQGGVLIRMTTGRLTHLETAIDLGIAHLRASTRRDR
ncbi:hypothetical protein ACIP3A_14745 [Streptomyces tricolor]|uniref:hypothetical protein n=1 Tax=Streptomyces TaxID=1883 RepID=UPI000B1CD207|nr:hypothetical protein [Streptomyces sp. PBH53]